MKFPPINQLIFLEGDYDNARGLFKDKRSGNADSDKEQDKLYSVRRSSETGDDLVRNR